MPLNFALVFYKTKNLNKKRKKIAETPKVQASYLIELVLLNFIPKA